MKHLSDVAKAILDLEALTFRSPARKEQEIRERFDWSPTVYYQHLNRLIDHPAALVHSPTVVNRLRRLRERHREQRSNQLRSA